MNTKTVLFLSTHATYYDGETTLLENINNNKIKVLSFYIFFVGRRKFSLYLFIWRHFVTHS